MLDEIQLLKNQILLCQKVCNCSLLLFTASVTVNSLPPKSLSRLQFVKIKIKIMLNSYFHEIGVFNEADTLESSSILIYSHLRQDNLCMVSIGAMPGGLKQIKSGN